MKTRRKFIKESIVATVALTFPSSVFANKEMNDMAKEENFDVIIIGGSYAGLSAAMALGRSLRNVLIIDAGSPCNKQTPYSHNFITHDGARPAEITKNAKRQVLRYSSVKYLNARVLNAVKTDKGFEITTDKKNFLIGKKLILATGIKDILPKIDGFAECWGISAIHCPYCHGYEVRQVKTGILANGDGAYESAKLISNWTKDLTIFTNGGSKINPHQVADLERKNITIVEKQISSIIHNQGYITELSFVDQSTMPLKALYAKVGFEQQINILSSLGCELNDQGYIKVDQFQKTSIEGVFACGDNTTFFRSVSQAVYAGNVAGGSANMEMIKEDWTL